MTRAATAFLCTMCGSASAWSQQGSDADPISEDRLLAYAMAPYDMMLGEETPFVLGSFAGVEVVVDSSCSDLCPTYTTRIIHFDLRDGQSCAGIGGVERSQKLGGWGGELTRCFPRVISDHWEDYVNARGSPWVSPGDVARMRLQSACEGRQGQVIERREGPATCPEELPTYVSFVDLIVRPGAIDDVFVSVVGFVGSIGQQPALFMTVQRDEANAYPLRNPESLTLVPPCRNQPIRVMGTFHASPVPEIVVAEVLMDDVFRQIHACE